MSVCKEKPPTLPPLDSIGLMSRGGSGHRYSGALPPSCQASVGLGFTPSALGNSGANNLFSMGNFATMGTSNRPSTMQRNNRVPGGSAGQGHGSGLNNNMNQMHDRDPVVPLQASENRWDRKAIQADQDSPELVERKVKGLLNKLTMEKFASISDQIIAWVNKSEKGKAGRTLIPVVRLVFEEAIMDEATRSEMYARLCKKMMGQISTNVQDDGIKNSKGKPVTGGQLFRKYLLTRCQEDFERGWVAKEATAAAAATKALEGEEGGIMLYSDEHYATQKARRQSLGLIKFTGELFKLQMLTERIMHDCVKKLLGKVDTSNPEEEEIERLCTLLSTVGSVLDIQKARAHLDVYFSQIKELMKSPNVTPRMQFMLQVRH
jgi:translation initiation factor 4G